MQLSRYKTRFTLETEYLGTTLFKCIFDIQQNECLKIVCYISPESGKNDVDLGVQITKNCYLCSP